ncbi:PREDICTED: uncharacterized protein LOC109591862, partial [Amphimedon queenslandica]|uniref:Uncharacterized protein n=2 Tax=Amphimedon queenslandica TaxID=400682 RepID=A0AAN0K1A6_AMPQE
AADLPEIPPPPSYDDLDTTTDPVIEPSTEYNTVSSQAAPNECFYFEAEKVSQITETNTLCVLPPVEQPRDGYEDHSSRCFEYHPTPMVVFNSEGNYESTSLPVSAFVDQNNTNIAAVSTQVEEKTFLFHDSYDDWTKMSLENDEESGHSDVLIAPHIVVLVHEFDIGDIDVKKNENEPALVRMNDKIDDFDITAITIAYPLGTAFSMTSIATTKMKHFNKMLYIAATGGQPEFNFE